MTEDLSLLSVPNRIRQIYSTCTEQEQFYLRKILEEFSRTGESKTYNDIWLADYIEIPVDIDTFITSDRYLGRTNRNGEAVYPYWRKVLHEIFSSGNKYHENFFTGATRIGKSSTAITGTIYMTYRLMCLRDPQKYFDKKDVSKFSILFFNVTKDLASGVGYREYNDTVIQSEWFMEHGTKSKSDRNFYYIPEGGKVIIDYGSDSSHALGQQVFVGFCDEMNFSRAGVKDVNKAKEHMKNLYNTVADRVKGTFRMGGDVYGKLFAVSSKRSDSDFMEAYIQEQLAAGAGDHMYVADAPQWEVLPESMFHKEKFYIAVGDRHKKGFVVPDNQTHEEALTELRNQGYMLMTPPIDMKPEFTADFDIALRDLAGISVPGALSFITQDSLTACINKDRKNPFYSDILQIGTKDNYSIEEFFHVDEVPKELKRMPMFIHLDLSLNTDKTGIAGSVISGRKDIDVDGRKISQPTFAHIFQISIQAPRGDKIPYGKITAFICWLRKQGFNISRLSRDQFQSEYMAQLLEEQGFEVDKISLDRTPDGYIALRSVLLEKRVDMLDSQLLQQEIIHLQRDSVTGKVDHPVGGCFTGDTKIRLVDGRSLSILELIEEQQYKTNWVYTVNEDTHHIEPKRIVSVHQTKLTSRLVKITLDNGGSIVCTPDHRFMLRDGEYLSAEYLTPGTSLMPLYTKVSNEGLSGYRLYYDPGDASWHYEHRKFCKNAKLVNGYVVHHKNYNKLDNCPTNLVSLTTSKHREIHNNSTQDYSKTSASVKKWHAEHKNDAAYVQRSLSISRSVRKHLQSDEQYQAKLAKRANFISGLEEHFGVNWSMLSPSERAKYSRMYSFYLDPKAVNRMIAKRDPESEKLRRQHVSESTKHMIWITNGIESRYVRDTEEIPDGFYRGRVLSATAKSHIKDGMMRMSESAKESMRQKQSKSTSNLMWVTDGVTNRYVHRDSEIPEGFHRGRCNKKNHKVVSIEFIYHPCRVYDLTIEDNPNFALDAGVFVHNSKDSSDAFAGSIWNAIMNNPGIPVPAKTVSGIISSVNRPRGISPGRNNQMPPAFNTIKRYN